MTGWRNLYYDLLNLFIKIFVRSKSIPADPVAELGLDISLPIMYVLPYNSKTDLLALCEQCRRKNLPNPLDPLIINNAVLPRYVFIHNGPRIFPYFISDLESAKYFHEYLNLHRIHLDLDVQMVPVSIMFGRSPGREIEGKEQTNLRMLNGIQKFFALLWLGRDSFVRFSKRVSLRNIANDYGTDTIIAQKLARVAHMHFARQRLATVGPPLPVRQKLFNKLLQSKAIAKTIEDEVRSKKISYEKAQRHAIELMEEIAADFSYDAIRLTDRIMSWTWRKLYKSINVNGSERVRQLAQDGNEIVYIPCHRSHIDYLLLSYVLYHQGLVPPHIAAGINLNFWPAGPIFRRLGAFFIHRTFKGNKLYSTVFREYLGELFTRGYSVEYFVEGGRSRTGRLLDPKTGTLSMTLQAMLRGSNRPITLVPIYIGYEHVMEVCTYAKELHGATKKKESFISMVRALCKLHNFGQVYVNFSEPLPLITYLNQHAPEWRKAIDPIEAQRPSWLTTTVNDIAQKIMMRINDAGAANAMNMCVTALLSSRQYSMTREQLIEQLNCYTQLLRSVPYSPYSTVPDMGPEALLEHALSMNKFELEQDSFRDIIFLNRKQAVLMTYYRNNIHHMLVMPSLIAAILMQHRELSRTELLRKVSIIYPMLKKELFLRWDINELPNMLNAWISELSCQELLVADQTTLRLSTQRFRTLQLLAAGVHETLQRYVITFFILRVNPKINRRSLEKKSHTMAQCLAVAHGINAPEFFDKAVFASLVLTLRDENYISDSDSSNASVERIQQVYQLLANLVTQEVRMIIESLVVEPD